MPEKTYETTSFSQIIRVVNYLHSRLIFPVNGGL